MMMAASLMIAKATGRPRVSVPLSAWNCTFDCSTPVWVSIRRRESGTAALPAGEAPEVRT